MMDPEDLQSDLLALRRLYRLLINNEHYVDDASSGNLDKNTRRLLMDLLDTAASKAFDAHAKMLGTQFGTTYKPWPTPQQQSRERTILQPFSVRTAPTDGAYASLQNVDYLTGQGVFNEPTNQANPSGEPGVRLKRCRVCQKPKVKQLTKEISFGDSKALTSVDRLLNQNHKRSWEDQYDPATVGGSASSANSPSKFDFFKSLTLTNSTVQEDHVSKEASSKILQLDSCISSLQVAAKHANFVKNNSENEPQIAGSTSLNIWKPTDNAYQWHDQTTGSINQLTVQDPWVNTMPPSRQHVEEPVVNQIEMFSRYDHNQEEAYYPSHSGGHRENQYGHATEEAYYPSQSGGHMENQYGHITDEAYYPNLEHTAGENRFLHRTFSGPIKREPLDQLQLAKTETMSELNEWLDPHGYGRPINKEQESESVRRKKPVYSDQIDPYRGKHEVIEPKRLVYDAAQRFPDTPVSGSNYSTQGQNISRSPSPSQSSNSVSDNLETYSRSSRSVSHENSESDMNSGSSQDQSPSGSFESQGSMSRWTVPKRGHKKGDLKEPKGKGVIKINTVPTWDQNLSTGSSSRESSGSMVSRKGHKKGHQKEPKRKSESKSPSMSSTSSESSGSRSVPTVHKKGHQKEPVRKRLSRSPSMSSTSSESSESLSSSTVHEKGRQKDPGRKRLMNSPYMSSTSSESSGSGSSTTVHEQGRKKGLQKELKRKTESKMNPVSSSDQTPSTNSSSSESSWSASIQTAPKKGHEKVPEKNQVGRLSKLKDKLAIIFQQQHHHHHHHHHHHDDSNKTNTKKAIWKQAKQVISHSRKKKDEAHGEVAVKKLTQSKPALKMLTHGVPALKLLTQGEPAAKKPIHADEPVKKPTHADEPVKKPTHADEPVKKLTHTDEPVKKLTHADEAAKKNEEKAIVVHKGNVRKEKQQLQALVGGLLKKTHHEAKSSKSKSQEKGSPSHSSGQKQKEKQKQKQKQETGSAKTGKTMLWWQMLRQQRKIKRIEKLREQIDFHTLARSLK